MEAPHLQDEEFEQEQSREDAILEQLIMESLENQKGKPKVTYEEFCKHFGLEP